MSDAQPPAADLAVAERAVDDYDLPGAGPLQFVRHGENTIFRIDAADGSYALRVHRPGYQTLETLRSEMAWTDSLTSTGIRTAPPVPGRDGDVVRLVEHDGQERLVSVLRWMPGLPLAKIDRLNMWHRLGELTATVHRHGQGWDRPSWFARRTWDAEGLVGDQPLWGDPLRLGEWDDEQAELLARCQDEVRARLVAHGHDDPERFGLIHADLSFENVLVQDDGATVLIDFDDGGFGWYLYDLAVSLYPFEDSPGYANRRDAMVAGYRAVRPLPEDELAELPTFLMARRLATLGWIFTHGDTEHARRQRAVRLKTFPGAAARFLDWVAYRRTSPPATPARGSAGA